MARAGLLPSRTSPCPWRPTILFYGLSGPVGGAAPHGEKGVLTVPMDQFMRLYSNPFFPICAKRSRPPSPIREACFSVLACSAVDSLHLASRVSRLASSVSRLPSSISRLASSRPPSGIIRRIKDRPCRANEGGSTGKEGLAMKRSLLAASLTVGCVLLICVRVFGQAASGAISGKITDVEGRPVAGAMASVSSPLIQGTRSQGTNADGEFLIPYLPPGGGYVLSVEAAGYTKVVQSRITVFLGSTVSLQFALAKAGGSVVEVSAMPPLLDTKHTRLSTNLTQSDLEIVPVGRQVQDSFYLAPQVVDSGLSAVAGVGLGNPGVKGSTGGENIYVIDGMNLTDPVGASWPPRSTTISSGRSP